MDNLGNNDSKIVTGWTLKMLVATIAGVDTPKVIWTYYYDSGRFLGILFAGPTQFSLRLSEEVKENHVADYPIEKDRHSMIFDPCDSDKLLSVLRDGYNCQRPPHFDTVLSDIIAVRAQLPTDKETTKIIASKLIEKWRQMVGT